MKNIIKAAIVNVLSQAVSLMKIAHRAMRKCADFFKALNALVQPENRITWPLLVSIKGDKTKLGLFVLYRIGQKRPT